MTGVLVGVAAVGWSGFLLMIAVRRADKRHLARTMKQSPSVRPDFSVFADEAERSGMVASAAMYRTMDEAWPKPDHPQAVRSDPGTNHLPAPRIDREDVRTLHGTHVYRNFNRPADEPEYRRHCDLAAEIENRHPLDGRCICHHAVWHSCPDPMLGERIFNALPSRGATQPKQATA